MSTRRELLRRLVACNVAALALARTAGAAAGIDLGQAKGYVDGLGQRAITVLAQKASPSRREEQLGELLRTGFDLAYLGRIAVGRTWREMSPDQRDHYQRAFDLWVLKTYAARLSTYGGQTFAVTGADPAGDEDAMVRSEIRGGASPLRVDWRVRRAAAGLRVVDVVVEGVSMVVTHRNEFQAIVQRQGIDGLIVTLRARAEQVTARPA